MSNKVIKIIKPIKNLIPHDKINWLDQVEIRISHTTGGINYYNNKQYPAGWYIHFQPVHVENKGTYTTTTTQLFHERAFKIYCCDGKRFSAKKLETLGNILKNNIDLIVEYYDNNQDYLLHNFIMKIFGEIK